MIDSFLSLLPQITLACLLVVLLKLTLTGEALEAILSRCFRLRRLVTHRPNVTASSVVTSRR